jgi:hypothetical protein
MDDLVGFKFLVILVVGYKRQLVLPHLLADELEDHLLRDIELRESSGGQPYWDLLVRVNEEGRMYLDEGWAGFADWYPLRTGNVLKFWYRGNIQFIVKIFDRSMCCCSYWPYFPADGASDGSLS